MNGVLATKDGESYATICRYFIPEFVTAFLLYSLPAWLDSYFISHLESTYTYATLGATNNLLHLLFKLAEAISVGTVILSGQFNGMKQFKEVGQTVRDAFWVTIIIGMSLACFLYLGAYSIYQWYGVPSEIVEMGIPFLRMRAIATFLAFVLFALVGFLRGIKNTFTPMVIFMAGSAAFIFFDYLLIYGYCGFPCLGLQGSAVASIIQYSVMLMIAMAYVVWHPENRKYAVNLFQGFKKLRYVWELLELSMPVMLDKAIFAWAYVWLCKMLCPMGTTAIATFSAIKDLERISFLPAIALAQVITFLVSNDFGAHNWTGIKNNIKKVTFLSSILVFSMLWFISYNLKWVLSFLDKKGEFTPFAAKVFPILSILVFFDLLQLILSGALRGAGNVKTVMLVRFAIIVGYFVPVSYTIAQFTMHNEPLKFILIYGSFYLGNALMSVIYVYRFRGNAWKESILKGNS